MVDPLAYERWRRTALGSTTETLEQDVVFGLCGDLAGTRVLDVGCGDGTYTLGATRRGAHAIGFDISDEMLAAAERRAKSENLTIEFVRGDVRQLPFADRSFDVVLAVTVLCFLQEAGVALREMARVHVPGGRLVLGELGRRSTSAAWRRLRSWFGSRTWREPTFRTPRELRTLLAKAGLSAGRVSGAVYYPPVGRLARWMAPLDRTLSTLTAEGAAFVAAVGLKPREEPETGRP